MDDILYSLFLQLGVGSALKQSFLDFFGSAENVFHAGVHEWALHPGITMPVLRRMMRTDERYLQSVRKACDKADRHIVTQDSPDYPQSLKMYTDCPAVLFVDGNVSALNRLVCVCGTRTMDQSGDAACGRAAKLVYESGRRILSFATAGCDCRAAAYALQYGSVCVALAWGLDKVGSSAERRCIEAAKENGAVVSVFAPQTVSGVSNFYIRNKFASQLCDGAVIVQSSATGNSLQVAERFTKTGKPVFASAGSDGCNALLNSGAYSLNENMDSVLLSYADSSGSRVRFSSEDGATVFARKAKTAKAKNKISEEKALFEENRGNSLDNLSQNSIIVFNILKETGGVSDYDSIILRSSLSVTDAMDAFTQLEIEGYIEILPGNRCILK